MADLGDRGVGFRSGYDLIDDSLAKPADVTDLSDDAPPIDLPDDELDPGGRVRHVAGDRTYEQLAEAVLVAHQRRDAGSCLCGWGELGQSHARHVARVLRAAGALRP